MKVFKILPFFFLASFLFLPQAVFAEAGWDDGFYIKSEDGQFKLDLGGRVQFQEVLQKQSGNRKLAAGTAPNDFSDTFKLRRARIQTTGTLFEKLDWFTILNIATAGTTGTPTAFLFTGFTYNFTPAFMLSGGMVQLPLDRMGENSSAYYLGVEPPLTATQEDGIKDLTIARNSLSLPFDLGLRVDGDVGNYFTYAVGLANGNGFQNTNLNNELSYGLALFVHPLGRKAPFKETDLAFSDLPLLSFNVGAGLEDEDQADSLVAAVTRQWSWVAAGGTAFRYRGFSLNSELYYRVVKTDIVSTEDTNGDRKLKDIGYYGNAGYFVVPKKLEFMLTAAQIFREGPDNNANEFGGGLNYYVHGNKVKLQLDYTNVLDYDDIPGLDNATYHRVRLMFSMFI